MLRMLRWRVGEVLNKYYVHVKFQPVYCGVKKSPVLYEWVIIKIKKYSKYEVPTLYI